MRLLVIVCVTLGVVVAMFFVLPPIPQDPAYHNFADQRTILGVPNFFDVFSNIAFLLVGLRGLVFLRWSNTSGAIGSFLEKFERWPYFVLFGGMALTCFGSAYYHLAPNNARLFWDRLPMTLIFMSLFAAIIAEWINTKIGMFALMPLISIGVCSVIYWYVSELRGQGDLRFYIMVQFYPMLAIPLILLWFPAKYTRSTDLLGLLAFYALAKVFELLDAIIFDSGQIVSGHTLKHLAAALAVYWLLRMLKNRQPVSANT